MVPGRLQKGDRMDDKQQNQLIGYAVVAIIAYHILQAVVPFLIYGVIGVVMWRVYREINKPK
jgi:hypothetical protein